MIVWKENDDIIDYRFTLDDNYKMSLVLMESDEERIQYVLNNYK